MAFSGVSLLVLLLACYALLPTLARKLDIQQRNFVQSEDANSHWEEARSAGLLVSKKQRSPAETEHAHLHPKPELSFDDTVMSISHEEEMSLPSLSLTEGILLHPSELVLHDDDTIPSILAQNSLPIGLLPSSVASYSITDDGEFTISLQNACYVKFDYEVYYALSITGKLSYGTITDLSGIQAKEAFFWVPITAVRTDNPSSEYIYFDAGPISKKLSISQFQTIPVCKVKATASSALA